MEEAGKGENEVIVNKNGTVLGKTEVTEESKLVSSKDEEIKEVKSAPGVSYLKEDLKKKNATQKTENKQNKVELQNPKQNTKLENLDKDIQRKKRKKKSSHKVLKRKLTEDGATIEKVLSEGEASPGFETVSSIDSRIDFEDFSLSPYDSELDYNVIVQVENDLAYENYNKSNERSFYWDDDSPVRSDGRADSYLGKNQRQNGFRSHWKSEHWERDNKDRQYKYYGSERWSREKEGFHHSRKRASPDRGWSKSSDQSRMSKGSRCSDQSGKFRGSMGSDRTSLKGSKTTHSSRSRRSRSCERDYESRELRSPSYRVRQSELRHSGSFSKSKSNLNRNLPPRIKNSFSKSSSASVWERLDSFPHRDSLKKDRVNKPSRFSSSTHVKKKDDRIPFLVELDRKLKEAENQKNSKREAEAAVNQINPHGHANEEASAPAPVIAPNPGEEHSGLYAPLVPFNSGMYSFQSTAGMYPMPTVSLENLPLVPGPTGLPVHVTMTGEQIPHDMDGRRIPVGPNGFYLPLDPTGRLFAHIVSPGNQAVPIHMTEDGVLRLPNSEPVPFGPSHNLPVNIDGSIIYMGPDSRPLCPCPNIPRQPAVDLLQVAQFPCFWLTQAQQEITTNPQTCGIENGSRILGVQALAFQNSNPSAKPQPSTADSHLLDFIQNPPLNVNKADLLIKYQKRANERSADVLKCKEIEKNLGVCPSKGGVKRSTPMKFTQKKTSKDEYSIDCDLNTDSNNPGSASEPKSSFRTKKDSSGGEIAPALEVVENILGTVCDKNSPTALPTESKSEDLIIRMVKQALKSLNEKNFKPPSFGRFILSTVMVDPLMETSPNISPLLRKAAKLPFLTPNAYTSRSKQESGTVEKTAITFKFLAVEKSSEKGEKTGKFGNPIDKNLNPTKVPVFTFDFAMQCDFTTATINNLTSKVAELEMEVVRLRNVNANLLDGFRNVQMAKERKSEELGKALQEIEKRKNEIVSLKRLISEKKN